ncbi:MAG: Mur ligase family protein [Steroidobacteraceae bacterium]
MTDAPEPHHGFANSRRLTGPNRYFAEPAATLTPLGEAATDPEALQDWVRRVRAVSTALGWPDPMPVIERRTAETILAFKAPRDALLTATDLGEWAWERAAARAGEFSFDLAQNLGHDPTAVLRARAAEERRPEIGALRAAASDHRLPFFEDDEAISIGAGSGSRTWRRTELPSPAAVPFLSLHDVPTALVAGSNGKTTTVRLLAAMTADAGLTPGYCCTDGVFVGGRAVAFGDYSGPDGARSVLRHPQVQLAVLETARGGILRRGLAVERADVAVVTNIQADHLGEYGMESAEDLAETKLVVARAVCRGGTLVLNADDATLMAAAMRLPYAAAAARALFAWEFSHPALVELRARGGSTCAVREGQLMLHHAEQEWMLGEVERLPLTFDGAASYNVANLAAAALAGAALGLPLASVANTVRRFGAVPRDNPGRLERWRLRGAQVLMDFAHNPDALGQLLRTARALGPRRLCLLLGQAGNRSDDAIAELARTAAGFEPDCIVIKELPKVLRGRALGEVPALIKGALLGAGVAAERICMEPDEETAARRLLNAAGPGDVIVLPVHTREVRERLRVILDPHSR